MVRLCAQPCLRRGAANSTRGACAPRKRISHCVTNCVGSVMFPLQTKSLPPNVDALRAALEEGLRQVIVPARQMVSVEDKNYPNLAALRLTLDDAQASERARRPARPIGAIEPGLQVEDFQISGRPISIQGAKIEFACTGREVRIDQARDESGNVLLLVQDAASGQVEVAVRPTDLEALILAGAKAQAAKHGVNVESVRIEMNARSERSIDVVVHVAAKKLFLNATIRISGSLAIDEHLNAKLSSLECTGEGTLGTIACGFIAPHLVRFNGRNFSLMALPLGEMKLRDLRIAADDKLRVTAQFGHA